MGFETEGQDAVKGRQGLGRKKDEGGNEIQKTVGSGLEYTVPLSHNLTCRHVAACTG